jgi:hypothetical protein
VTDAGSTPWLAYSTAERVVGLMSWPLDSECSMGLIAHPGGIQQVVLSYDGRQLITLGEAEAGRAVAVAAQSKCGCMRLVPESSC